jgi:hypothetical protein
VSPGEKVLLSMARRYRIEVEIARDPTRYYLSDPMREIIRCESLFDAMRLLGNIGARGVS